MVLKKLAKIGGYVPLTLYLHNTVFVIIDVTEVDMVGHIPKESFKRNALIDRDALWNTKDVPYVLDESCTFYVIFHIYSMFMLS